MSVSEVKLLLRESAVSSAQTDIAESSALERCYSPEQIAERWSLSPDTVRRIFGNEPGVLAIERSRIYGKRRYRTLRIPESVAQRVYHRLALKGRPIC
jgi:hypothetical protein